MKQKKNDGWFTPFESKVWGRLYNRDNSKDTGNKKICGLSFFNRFCFYKKGGKEIAYHDGKMDCLY